MRLLDNFHHLFGWIILVLVPFVTGRLAAQLTSDFVAFWAQLAWLARALNGRKLAGVSCAGELGVPAVRMLG
jgi:hypothetical protein